MSKNIDCFIPYLNPEQAQATVSSLKESKEVNHIFLLCTAESSPEEIEGCERLDIPSLYTYEAAQTIAQKAKAPYTLVYFKEQPVTFTYLALERFVNNAADAQAYLTYADHWSIEGGETKPAPCIDYQMGSLRDDFDFGSVLLYQTDQLKQFFLLTADSFITELKHAIWYAIRLEMSDHIFHIQEKIYTEQELDLRKSGEKQFDYVDPRNRDRQIEMEEVCTWYLQEEEHYGYLEPGDYYPMDITADEFRQFCSPVVPLAKIERFTYLNSEQFKAALLLNQFQGRTLHDVTVKTTIKGTHDVFSTSEQRIGDIPVGQNFRLDSVKFSLGIIKIPTKMTLEVDVVEGLKTVGRNHWDFWVYPKSVLDDAGDVLITDKFDDKARETLANGGKVLLTAAGKITYGKDIVQQFTPVFWNTSWFKMRPPHTTGICLDPAHPVFSQFPTDYHSDLQWWELVEKAQVMQFTEFPKDFQPIVQSIDTWFLSRKIGMLFEANIGNGKLMMTTMDITNNLDTRIVARQMRASILSYMNSGKFNPKYTLESQLITDLFTKQAPRVDMFTNESPDELKPKIK